MCDSELNRHCWNLRLDEFFMARLSRNCSLLLLSAALLVCVVHFIVDSGCGVITTCKEQADRSPLLQPMAMASQVKRTVIATTAAAPLSLKQLVVVTGFSSKHYSTSLGMLTSVQRLLPGTRVIVYDLGLNVAQRANLRTLCNVELRRFNFHGYPLYFQRLASFGLWKPVVMKEAAEETDMVLFLDSNVRIKQPLDKDTILNQLAVFPVQGVHSQSRAVQYTHDDTLRHFGVRRESMRGFTTVQTSCLLMQITDATKKLLDLWAGCVLNRSCIYPVGVITMRKKRKFCDMNLQGFVSAEYTGCHQFSQSALNVALVRLFGKAVFNKIVPNCTISRHGKGAFNEIEDKCTWMRYFDVLTLSDKMSFHHDQLQAIKCTS